MKTILYKAALIAVFSMAAVMLQTANASAQDQSKTSTTTQTSPSGEKTAVKSEDLTFLGVLIPGEIRSTLKGRGEISFANKSEAGLAVLTACTKLKGCEITGEGSRSINVQRRAGGTRCSSLRRAGIGSVG